MAKECAFCPETANRSGEHVFSDWMNTILPGKKWFFSPSDDSVKARLANELDLKANVVCEICNNGWMSKLESEHGKPVIADLILGKSDIPISQSKARSIAIFAFKTAVILEHMSRKRSVRFVPRDARYRFKTALEIPHNVQMWMAYFLHRTSGACFSVYHEIEEHGRIELYVCNYRAGHFAFQVVIERKPSFLTIVPHSGFEYLAIPFWPRIPAGFIWPPQSGINTSKEFRMFGQRWHTVRIFKFTGD